MSLFGSRKNTTPAQPTYTSIPVQTAVWDQPVAYGQGTFLAAANMIGYDDFSKTTKSSSGSGKGGVVGGGGKGGGETDYTVSIWMGLCEGPASVVSVAKDGTSFQSLSDAGFSFLSGAPGQTPWGYLVTAHPDKAFTYPGLAYVVANHFDLGSTPQVPSNNFIMQGNPALFASWAATPYPTADAALLIQDVLTNARYGVQGFRASAIDTTTLLSTSAATTTGDASFQTYCRAMGWGLSPYLATAEKATDTIKRWLQITNSAAVWSGNVLKFIPFGDVSISGNGVTYVPNLTPVANLTTADFLDAGPSQDPIRIKSRVDPTDLPNILRLTVTSSDGYFTNVPTEARDQLHIDTYGAILGSSIQAGEIIGMPQGLVVAGLLLQRNLNTPNTYTGKLDWTRCLLEPMDIVTIPNPATHTGSITVRIISIEEADDDTLEFEFEDFPGGLAGLATYSAQSLNGGVPNRTALAAPVNIPLIFEPPVSLTGGLQQIWMGFSGRPVAPSTTMDPTWGGADIYLSSDGITYQKVGSVTEPLRQGLLTAALPVPSLSPDTTHVLAVNLQESAGALMAASALDALAGRTLSYVDGELLSYSFVALTGTNSYSLGTLYRGQYGTAASAHLAGSQFARLDEAVFAYDLPDAYIGQTIFLKAVSTNIWGVTSALATATAYSFMPGGKYIGWLRGDRPEDSGLLTAMGLT